MKTIKHNGFTFMEVMVVIVIIGLLAGAVGISVKSNINKARINRAKSDIASIVNAVELFYLSNGRFPTNEEGLAVVDVPHTTDTWKRQYMYNQPGRNGDYDVFCYGADGREGGVDADEDIYSDQLSNIDMK